jgi:hypothetical protein
VFLRDNHRVYTAPPVPEAPWDPASPETSVQTAKRELLTRCYNCLSNLQCNTVFKLGPAEKKVELCARQQLLFLHFLKHFQVSIFGGLSSKFSARYLVLHTTGDLHIYSSKDDFDQHKSAEEVVSLEDVTAQKVPNPSLLLLATQPPASFKAIIQTIARRVSHHVPLFQVQSKSGTGATGGPQYLELFQPFKGQIELCFSNIVAQMEWLDCIEQVKRPLGLPLNIVLMSCFIEQVQAHLKRIDRQKAELGGSEGKSSATEAAEA